MLAKFNTYKFNKINQISKYVVEFECTRVTRKIDDRFIGKFMRQKIVTLGPSFIKIGQFISTRQDIFSKELCDELKGLQDNVPAVPFDRLSIPQKIRNSLAFIDEKPLASASIGQVYKGKLQNGKDVVLKILRPNIKENIQNDFELVTELLKIAENVIDSRRTREFSILFNEYYKILTEEIDFKKEISNMKRFSQMFSDTPWIKIPFVYEDLSNSSIITMEYVDSVKIDNVDKISKMNFNMPLIADKIIESFVNQIIDYGIVHLDLHPSNLGISKNGKLCLYDFGMTLTLDKNFRESFNSLLIAIYDKDVNEIYEIAVRNNFIILNQASDKASFKLFMMIFLNYLEKLNVDDLKDEYLETFKGKELNFMLSSKFFMLLRGISIIEGICKLLDPKFTYKKNLDKYINKLVFNLDSIEKKANKDINKLLRQNDVENLKSEIELLKTDLLNANSMQQTLSGDMTSVINEKKIMQVLALLFALLNLL